MKPIDIDQALIGFVERSQDNLRSLEADLLKLESEGTGVVHSLLRVTVSLRTEAEMLGITPIEDLARCFTQYLKVIRDHPLQPDTELITLLLKLFDVLESGLQAIFELRDLDELDQEMKLHSRSTLQTLDSYIAVLKTPTELLFSEIEQIFPLKSAAHETAAEYGKAVEVVVSGGDIPIPTLILNRLPRLLTHLLTNAIVHGIETPDVRRSRGKLPTGTITLTASCDNQRAVIRFADDGAGINVERVKAKAIAKGLITESAAMQLSDADVYEFLFHPDFSTRDVRDLWAGRGYGLDIVRNELRKIGGSITVSSIPNGGTTFTIVYSP